MRSKRPDNRLSFCGSCPFEYPHLLETAARHQEFLAFLIRCASDTGYNPLLDVRSILVRVVIMGFKLDRVHVWSGEVMDQAGGVAAKLALVAQSGANLEYIYTRRLENRPGMGMLYVAPITGALQLRAARSAGLSETDNPVVLRVEGDNQAGLAHRLTQQWALAGLSLHGLMMSVLSDKFVGYASFDSVADSNRAAAILGDLGAVG